MAEGPLDKQLDLFKELAWDIVLKKALQSWLTKTLGAMIAGGPVGWLLTAIISSFANHFYEYIKDLLNLNMIEFTNEKFQAEYDRASVKLQIIYDSDGQSDEYKKVRDEHKKALQNFAQYGVARSA